MEKGKCLSSGREKTADRIQWKQDLGVGKWGGLGRQERGIWRQMDAEKAGEVKLHVRAEELKRAKNWALFS